MRDRLRREISELNPGYGAWVMATAIVSTAWWSMVFPLGMYAAASANYGRASGLGFMVDIARHEVWIGFAAWLGVFAAMVGSFLPARTARKRGNGSVASKPA